MLIIIAGFFVPDAATFGGRIRHTSIDPDIRINCFPFQEDTDRVFIGEYPRDKDVITSFLTWQCRCFLPFNPYLEFDWQLGYSSDELSNAKSSIISAIQTQCMSQVYLVHFIRHLQQHGDEEFNERRYSEAIDLYYSSYISLARWPGLLCDKERENIILRCLSRIFSASIRSNQRMGGRKTPCLSFLIRLILAPVRISFRKRSRCVFLLAQLAEACGAMGTTYALGFTAVMLDDDKRVEQFMQRITSRPADEFPKSIPAVDVQSLKRDLAKDEHAPCPVCKCDYGPQAVLRLTCNHEFHEECIVPWLIDNLKDTCPLCRHVLSKPLR